MMKILRVVAFATCFLATTAQAETALPVGVDPWPAEDLHDITQAWYFTGEALAPYREGPPWTAERPLFRPASLALAPPAPAAVPGKIHVPPTIPEPPMASMLLVGVLLIFLRMGRKEELFG